MIVGSGIAGLYAALLASDAATDSGRDIEVVLLSKGTLEQSNTFYAQGGVSAVLAPDEAAPGDSVAAHIADTLAAGAGLNDAEAVRVLCTEAVRDIAGLGRYGVHFDMGPDGGPALGLEAAHSAPRILHAGGDATGACIARGLVAAVLERAVLDRSVHGRLRVETSAFVTDLLTDPDTLPGSRSESLEQPGATPPARVTGVAYLAGGRPRQVAADAVLLATGGAGRLFSRTSNPAVATADGLALAWRAGAAVRDLEFFQFHPTTLAAEEIPGGPPALLISEAVRGEGAVLLDSAGYRFMPGYHPDAELAPRDVVSRSIALHLAATGAAPDSPVYLDARGIEAARGDGLPGPAVPDHHGCHPGGRLRLDLRGHPRVPGSPLLDGRRVHRSVGPHVRSGPVCRRRGRPDRRAGGQPAGEQLAAGGPGVRPPRRRRLPGRTRAGHRLAGTGPGSRPPGQPRTARGACHSGRTGATRGAEVPFSRAALGRLMTAAAGVTRTGAELDAAAAQLAQWAAGLGAGDRSGLCQDAHEDRNLLLAAELLVAAARQRTHSVGAHYRADTDATSTLARSMQRI